MTAMTQPRQGRTRQSAPLAYRLNVAGRSAAAVVGGFLLASAVAWLITALLIATGVQPRGPAIGTGTLLSWIVWTCGAMWAFYAPTQARAWAWLVIPAAALGGIALTLGLEA